MGLQGTTSTWRKDMLRVLKNLESQEVINVTWETANDEHVCPLCAERNGVTYTISEAKEQLKGKFCRPGDPDDRCRCTFVAAQFAPKKPTHSKSTKPKKQSQSGATQLIAWAIFIFIVLIIVL